MNVIDFINIVLFIITYLILSRYDYKEKLTINTRQKVFLLINGGIVSLLFFNTKVLIGLLTNVLSIEPSSNTFNILIFVEILLQYIGVALFEEALFRCALFEFINKKIGENKAIILASVLFALVHIVHFTDAVSFIYFFIEATLIGILFQQMYVYTKSIMFPVGFHTVWNLFESYLLQNNYNNFYFGDGSNGYVFSLIGIILLILINVYYRNKRNKLQEHFV